MKQRSYIRMDRQQLVKAKEIGMELLRGLDVGSSVTTKLSVPSELE